MTKKKSKQPKPKPAKPEKEVPLDSRGHKVGSRKSKVHEAFAKHDEGTAYTLALKLGLKPGTARSWIGAWRRAGAKSKPAAKAKPATKANSEKPTPADTAQVTA